jgi:hypothetical protein
MMVHQTTEVSIDGMRAAGQFSRKKEFHFLLEYQSSRPAKKDVKGDFDHACETSH